MQIDQKPQNLTFPGTITDDMTGSTQPAYAVRLWEYGARVETPATLHTGERITFSFALPGIDTRLRCSAMVLRYSAARKGMPAEADLDFSSMDARQKAVVRAVLSDRAARRADLAAAELIQTVNSQPLRVLFKTMSPSEVQNIAIDLDLISGDQLLNEGGHQEVVALLENYGTNLQADLHSRLEVKVGQFLLMDFSLPKLELGLGVVAEVIETQPVDEHGLCRFTARFHSMLKDDVDLIERALTIQKDEAAPSLPSSPFADATVPALPAFGSQKKQEVA